MSTGTSGLRLERYDESVVALIKEVRGNIRAEGKGKFKTLAELNRIAKGLQDNALLGFVSYYHADAYYFMHPDYEKFRQWLRRAIRYLLNSDNKELLGLAYNLVAIDAHNCGSYDIAHSYYTTVDLISEEIGELHLSGVARGNIGRLYSQFGEDREARRYYRLSLRGLRTRKSLPLYATNILTVYYLDGLSALKLDDIEGAEKDLEKIERMLAEETNPVIKNFTFPRDFLRAGIALSVGTPKELDDSIATLHKLLLGSETLHDALEDIEPVCYGLIERGMLKQAGELIKVAGEKIPGCGVTHIERRFCRLCEQYYDAIGEEEKAFENLREMNRLSVKEHNEQNSMSLYAITLSELMTDLGRGQEMARQENAALMIKAGTDLLTGLPNRYVMNEMLEAAYERAFAGEKELAVGILDIDYFKEYNDTYGHVTGDECLVRIAHVLRQQTDRPGLFCARYGGDEFVIIYEDMTEYEVRAHAKDLRSAVLSCAIRHDTSLMSEYVTISQGICHGLPVPGFRIWEYLTEADHALYSIKKARGKLHASRSGIRIRPVP